MKNKYTYYKEIDSYDVIYVWRRNEKYNWWLNNKSKWHKCLGDNPKFAEQMVGTSTTKEFREVSEQDALLELL